MDPIMQLPLSELLPHKAPMVLVDRLLSYDLQNLECRCAVAITSDCCFFEPGLGVPSYVGVEYMAQTVGVLSGIQQRGQSTQAPRLGFLLGFDLTRQQCEWFVPGQELVVAIRHEWGDQNLMQLNATIADAHDGRLLSEAKMNVFSPPDPDAFLKEAQA